jgi:hypothetical protein
MAGKELRQVKFRRLWRKEFLIATAAVSGAFLAPAAVSGAVPNWQEDAATAVSRLEAEGYRVIVNKLGFATVPLAECSVWSVRANPKDAVAHIDVNCDRDSRDTGRFPVRELPHSPPW